MLTFEWIWQSSLLFFYFDIQSGWLTCIVCHFAGSLLFFALHHLRWSVEASHHHPPKKKANRRERETRPVSVPFVSSKLSISTSAKLSFTWNLYGNLKLVFWLVHILWSRNWCLFLEAVKIGEDKKDKKEEKEVRTPARFSVPRRPHSPQRTCFQGHWAKLDAQCGFLFKSESTEITNFQIFLVGTHWQSI